VSLQISAWHSLGGATFVIMGQGEPVSPVPMDVVGIPSDDKTFPWPYLPGNRQRRTVFIRDLRDPHLLVMNPIPASLEFSDRQVTACCYDVEQFGVGEDEFTALDDLRATIVELYVTLKRERSLGPLPQRQLVYLTRALKEV
jgi:hypothetical protein